MTPACIRDLARCLGAALVASASLAVPAQETGKKDFSQAERLLLMTDQLGTLKAPSQLVYDFKHTGTHEAGFDDRVTLRLKAKPGSKATSTGSGQACCAADAQFLSGDRKVELPTIEEAAGNPVTLYFLEHDIREMKRLTKGSSNYFRKRIRMALYEAARVDEVNFTWQGKPVAGRQIVLEPYRDDPNRARFETMVRKQYVFTLSDAVPGAVAAIRTVIHPATGDAAMVRDEMVLQGVEPPPMPAMKPLDAAPAAAAPPAAPAAPAAPATEAPASAPAR